jgi:hypothetical protein
VSETPVTTEAGLVVPASSVTRKRRVLPADTFKRLKRFITDMDAEKIVALLVCADCQKPVVLRLEDRLVETDDYGNQLPGGRPVLRCQCSNRVVL